jgi:hypothetical protein
VEAMTAATPHWLDHHKWLDWSGIREPEPPYRSTGGEPPEVVLIRPLTDLDDVRPSTMERNVTALH